MATEVTQDHTSILRMTLAIEDCRAYWENVDTTIPQRQITTFAFENRWFGNKSMPRIQRMLADLRNRYDVFPQALEVLSRWKPDDPTIRQNICHWHLQLTDPIYRDFSAKFLAERRLQPNPRIDRDIVGRWLRDRAADRWAVATVQKIARNLITSAAEAGLCTPDKKNRIPTFPKISDISLTYLLYLLRQTQFSGTLLSNPYLTSVGLTDGPLEKRLRRLEGLTFGSMGDLVSFEWAYPDLKSWAENKLLPNKRRDT